MADRKKILVTGGTGYIGSHTVVELIDSGFDVVIVDDLSNSELFILDRIKQITGNYPRFYEFNLTEKEKLNALFDENRDIEGIIHFAASKAVGESVEKPLLYYRNNLVSLINLLEEMPKFDIRNFVFSSSCTVYGQPEKLPVTEESPVQAALSPYGNTKQISEEIIQDAIHSGVDINSISLRYFNPIGAHESALIGELPLGVPDNLVPFITQTAIGLREQLKVFGDDYNTPDGSCIRDYIHVVDLSRAHIAAIRRMLNKKNKAKSEVFNLGTGNGYSVFEVIQSFEKVSGERLNYKVIGRRPGDIEKVWADTRYANRELGWHAGKSLDDMILSAWKWEKNYRAGQNINK